MLNTTDVEYLIEDRGFFYQGTNGKIVILVHGLTGIPNEMKYLGKQLYKKGFSVICPMLIGHGFEKKTLLHTNYEDWYETIKVTYLEVKKKIDNVYVAGICVGGMLALKLAFEFQKEIKGIISLSTTIVYDGWAIPKSRVFSFLIPLIGKFPPLSWFGYHERYPFGIKDDRLRSIILKSDIMNDSIDIFPFPTLAEMYRLNNYMKHRFEKIVSPTLLIHSNNDDLSHERNARFVLDKLNCKKELVLLDDCYHMIHIDKQREKVANITADFCNAN